MSAQSKRLLLKRASDKVRSSFALPSFLPHADGGHAVANCIWIEAQSQHQPRKIRSLLPLPPPCTRSESRSIAAHMGHQHRKLHQAGQFRSLLPLLPTPCRRAHGEVTMSGTDTTCTDRKIRCLLPLPPPFERRIDWR